MTKILTVGFFFIVLVHWAKAQSPPSLPEGIEQVLLEDRVDEFKEVYEEYYDSISDLDVKTVLSIIEGGHVSNKTCRACQTLVKLSAGFEASSSSVEFVKGFVCSKVDGKRFTKRECEGLIERLGLPLLYIIHNTKVPMNEICSVALGHQCTKFLNGTLGTLATEPFVYWEVKLPPKAHFKPANERTKFHSALHLTDVHLDLWYKAGSNSLCNEPLCCRPTSYITNNQTHPAGHWGEIKGDCDLPTNIVDDSLKHIAKSHSEIDHIFWTGDNPPHDVWNTSIDTVLSHNKYMAEQVRSAFPNRTVLPALGNHEAHPINLFVPHEVSLKSNFTMKWLYETLANDYWKEWLNTNETRSTFLKGGYYSKMMNPGWKVIVLNSNVAYRPNLWRLYNPIDPDGQLEWLIKELDHAEKVGAYVTLLGHIPPKDMYEGWLHNYILIVERYSQLITGSFNGHTHKDEITLLMNKLNQPIGVNYISGSLTTYSYLNPSYKILKLNNRGKILNYDVYFLDLDALNQKAETNSTIKPVWEHEYNVLHSYGLRGLTNLEWNYFVTKAEKDLDLNFEYYQHYFRYAIEFPEHEHETIEKIKKLVHNIRVWSPFAIQLNNDHKNKTTKKPTIH